MRKLFSLGLAMLLAGTLTGCAAAEDAPDRSARREHRDGKCAEHRKCTKYKKTSEYRSGRQGGRYREFGGNRYR